MSKIEFIYGPNFSGRSALLSNSLRLAGAKGPVAYVGASAASALSGLTTTVAGERALGLGPNGSTLPKPLEDYFQSRGAQLLTSLSGGEQVLLALGALGSRDLQAVGLDSALEQLDSYWRSWALDQLKGLEASTTFLIDNRLQQQTCPAFNAEIRARLGLGSCPALSFCHHRQSSDL